jgi:hypothetical protein
MRLEDSRQIFEKYSNIKFHKILSNGSRVVPCGRTDRQTDMMKLIVIFCNFANAPKITFFVLERNEALKPTRLFCYNLIFYASIEFFLKKPGCNVQWLETAVRNYMFSFISVSTSSKCIVRTKWKVIFSWIPKLFLAVSFTFEVSFVKSLMKIVLNFAFPYAKPYRTE